MKVILKQDVSKLGSAGDLVEAADGYARNFLIPRGLAEEATPDRINQWEARGAAKKRREKKLKQEAEELRKQLSGKAVRVKASTGEMGKLFGSITAAAVAENLEAQHSAKVDKRDVRIPDAVKQTGNFPFTVRLYPGVEAEMTLVVESE